MTGDAEFARMEQAAIQMMETPEWKAYQAFKDWQVDLIRALRARPQEIAQLLPSWWAWTAILTGAMLGREVEKLPYGGR